MVILFFTLAQLSNSPENPHVLLSDGVQGAAESMLSFRLLNGNHSLLADLENTTATTLRTITTVNSSNAQVLLN